MAIVTCSFFGVYQAYFLLSDFLSYSKVTQITEHYLDTEILDEVAVPNIHVCNINPSGLLRHLPENETFSAFSKLVREKGLCQYRNCSESDKVIWQKITGQMLTMIGYIKYLGVHKAKDLFQNNTDFLVHCIVFPYQRDCFEFAEVTAHLSGFYLGCWTMKFPEALISEISITFYVDSFHPGIDRYVVNDRYSVKSSGVAFEVMERQRDIPSLGYETKMAPPGMLTIVHIKQEKKRRLAYPYGNCIESDAIESSFENCVSRCVSGHIFRRCNCENEITQSEMGKDSFDQSRLSHDTVTQSTIRRGNFGFCFDMKQTRDGIV